MGKPPHEPLDIAKPQFSQLELCEAAGITMPTANNWILTGALRPAPVGMPQHPQAEIVFCHHHLRGEGNGRVGEMAGRAHAATDSGGNRKTDHGEGLQLVSVHPATPGDGQQPSRRFCDCFLVRSMPRLGCRGLTSLPTTSCGSTSRPSRKNGASRNSPSDRFLFCRSEDISLRSTKSARRLSRPLRKQEMRPM